MSREQKLLKARLELLKCTSSLTHVISCPFDDGGRGPGAMKASEIAQQHDQPPASYCYFPNEDCPQELGRAEGRGTGWLQTWMAICDNAKRRVAQHSSCLEAMARASLSRRKALARSKAKHRLERSLTHSVSAAE